MFLFRVSPDELPSGDSVRFGLRVLLPIPCLKRAGGVIIVCSGDS